MQSSAVLVHLRVEPATSIGAGGAIRSGSAGVESRCSRSAGEATQFLDDHPPETRYSKETPQWGADTDRRPLRGPGTDLSILKKTMKPGRFKYLCNSMKTRELGESETSNANYTERNQR